MFGHIPDVSVGQNFTSREELARVGIHAPRMAGIWGSQEGACSIVLSGGYEDDIDDLDYIRYTGQGGQDAPGGKQIANQEFTRGNKGLQLSCQYKLPVRVVRGHQLPNGPKTGYRYDGLYYVKSFERIIGKRGFYICRFHLVSENSIGQLEAVLKQSFKPAYFKPDRVQITINKLQRNIKLSEKVKKLYDYRCQVCDVCLSSPCGPIAIGAHIRGVGRPHDGPDVIENMLCLCPNHHDQLDCFSYYIEPGSLEIIGLDNLTGRKLFVSKRHKLNKEFLQYHKELFLNKTSFK